MDNHQSRIMVIEVPRRSVSPVSPTNMDKHNGLFQLITRRFHRRTNEEYNASGEDSGNSSTDSCSSSNSAGPSSSNCSSIYGRPNGSENSINMQTRSDCEGHSNFDLSSSASDMSYSNSSHQDQNKPFKMSKSNVHFRSTSSIRRALKSLSLSSRSLSCTNATQNNSTSLDENNNRVKQATKKQRKLTWLEKHSSQGSINVCSSGSSSSSSSSSKTPPPPKRILRQPVHYTYLKGMSGLHTQRVPRSSVCCPQGYH